MERIYIHASISDWSGPQERVLEESYYGPFNDQDDAVLHMNDRFADELEALGNEVVVIGATDDEVKNLTINSREFWMTQLANLTKDHTNAQEVDQVQGS